jgi:hypothetical protein
MYHDERQPWETEGDLPWEAAAPGWQPAEPEGWRGEVHLEEWPEDLAGPEYWLYKRMREEES